MQILIFAMCLLLRVEVFAALSDLTCSKNGLDIFFINGVLIDDKAFRKDFTPQADTFFTEIVKQKNRLDLHPSSIESIIKHNNTEGLLRDIAESYFLYLMRNESKEKLPLKTTLRLLLMSLMNKNAQLDEYCSLNKALDICKELKKIIYDKQNYQTIADLGLFKDEAYKSLVERKRKLIFVTHSGGNLMADRVRDFILNELPPEYYPLTGHVSLARPYFTQHKNVETIVFEEDGVIESLRLAGQNTPPGNVSLQTRCDNFRFLPWFNHGFDCYLGNNLVQQNLYDIPRIVQSVEIVKAAVYKVASNLANNDENCCNKSPKGKVWINDDTSIGGFISEKIKIESGKVTINKGAQLCGTGSINATSDSSKHIFGEQVIINGQINLNSKFKVLGTTSISSSSVLTTDAGTDVQLNNLTLNGSLRFKKPAENVSQIDPWIIGATVNGTNEITGPVRITQSTFLKDMRISSKNVPLLIQNLKITGAGSLNLTENKNDQYTSISNIIVEAPLVVSGSNVNITGIKNYGSTTVTASESVGLSGEFRGTSSVTSGTYIGLSGKFNSVSGSCDKHIFLQGQLLDSLKFGDCDHINGSLTSNAPIELKGSYNISSELIGGGSVVGSKSPENYLAGIVSGTTNINAPNGFSLSGWGLTNYIVEGSVSYTSSATCISYLSTLGNYVGDISVSLSSDANTSYCANSYSPSCVTWGSCSRKESQMKKSGQFLFPQKRG